MSKTSIVLNDHEKLKILTDRVQVNRVELSEALKSIRHDLNQNAHLSRITLQTIESIKQQVIAAIDAIAFNSQLVIIQWDHMHKPRELEDPDGMKHFVDKPITKPFDKLKNIGESSDEN